MRGRLGLGLSLFDYSYGEGCIAADGKGIRGSSKKDQLVTATDEIIKIVLKLFE